MTKCLFTFAKHFGLDVIEMTTVVMSLNATNPTSIEVKIFQQLTPLPISAAQCEMMGGHVTTSGT